MVTGAQTDRRVISHALDILAEELDRQPLASHPACASGGAIIWDAEIADYYTGRPRHVAVFALVTDSPEQAQRVRRALGRFHC